jgi:CheY-like chemotaxis protein
MPKTVLIVEDDEDTRKIYAAALTERGYQVVTATQGAEGVHLARRHRPDLILLDIRMPVMNGWSTARYLKADVDTRHIPICAISAYDIEEEEGAGQPVHFDCFLMKPIDPHAVVAEVERRIGPPDPGQVGKAPPGQNIPTPE